MKTFAAKLATVVDDATLHVQEDGAVRIFVSPAGAKIVFEGPGVDPNTLQSVCTYVLGTKVPNPIDIDQFANADDPRMALNTWYFSQPWEQWRMDRALGPGEDQSVPITFLQGSREALVAETELALIGLHQDISSAVDAVRYIGAQGDPPAVIGRGRETNSLVRHLCHLIRRRNDFWAESRILQPGAFLMSKLKVSVPDIAVPSPDIEGAKPEKRARARDFVRDLLIEAHIVPDPSLFAVEFQTTIGEPIS